MKYINALLSQIIMWAGIYFGVMNGIEPVANLLGVALLFLSLFMIIVTLLAHWVFDTEYKRFIESFDKHSLGRFGNSAVKISSFLIGVVLIMEGSGWLILGSIWVFSILMQHSLKMRIEKENLDNKAVL